MFTKKINLWIISSLFLFTSSIYAASITQTKNNKVLLALDGDNANVGQTVSFKNSSDTVVASGTVTQAKGGKAIVTLKKGKVDGSEIVLIEDSSNGSGAETSYAKKGVYRLNSTKVAAVLTMGMNTMSTRQSDGQNPVPNTEDVALKGSSIGLTGTMDYPFNNWLILRGTLGYEPFNAAGTSRFLSCGNLTTTQCDALISYLSAGGYARFNFTKSQAQLWGALGGSFKFPIAKTTTALKSDDIKMTFTFGGALGLDYFINNKTFIPISAEYQMFQNSDTVSANMILFRAGYGWAW